MEELKIVNDFVRIRIAETKYQFSGKFVVTQLSFIMDPDGAFNGNTLTIQWKSVPIASKYLVVVEQCNENHECRKVVDHTFNSTRMEMTSSNFSPCTLYNLEVHLA